VRDLPKRASATAAGEATVQEGAISSSASFPVEGPPMLTPSTCNSGFRPPAGG
jgi:hypothetical protein